MSIVVSLERTSLDPRRELDALVRDAKGDGAVVTFVGLARPQSKAGSTVSEVILDHHPVLTQQSLEQIAAGAAERFEITQIRVVHRCGHVPAGEPIVFAGASAAHRRSAFDCADYLMDRLKTEAVFWKRETGEQGSEWIEPTERDYADRDRWG